MYYDTPWHFWPVLTVAFIWHLVGVIDYTATQYELEFWLAMATERQLTFIDSMPDWVDGGWAIAVWSGLLGVILAAFRTNFAPLVLSISFIATLVVTIWLVTVSDPSLTEIAGWPGAAVMAGACVMALLLWLYARAMHQEGVID
ncbi:hypothetical protein ILP92_09265 [Maribius pontilimi]|uniref:Uncharacterized protein n=1 Tax=Palleronia pontilimi TaxID=1964209 RepID=A0A934MCW4_9RHOB|nr:hypothetical protein [Palleronia pontilimi]MBJ3762930.1 hypothetical protein [Palleronia pontilimi]